MQVRVRGSFTQIPFWKLRARFRACGYFDGEVAAVLGVSKNTLSARLRGTSPDGWTEKEICTICEMMEIPPGGDRGLLFSVRRGTGKGEGQCWIKWTREAI